MATAWEVLKSNSTLLSGTAWDHLNNQAGGGGPATLSYIEGWDLEIEDMEYALQIDDQEVVLEIEDSDLVLELDSDDVDLEVD